MPQARTLRVTDPATYEAIVAQRASKEPGLSDLHYVAAFLATADGNL
jgi:hypothetical protein